MTSVVEKIRKGALGVSTTFFFCIVFANAVNLVWRWVAGESIAWILEISLILLVYSVLLCVPVLYARKELIQMSLIQGLVKEHRVIYVNLFVEIAILAFLVYMIPYSFSLSMKQLHTLSRGLGIPRVYITLPVLICVILCLVININNLVTVCKDLCERRKKPMGQAGA